MAKRVVDLDTLITKLGGVLNRDVYIINYTYCIGGDDTNDEKVSDIILELDSDFVNLLKEVYFGENGLAELSKNSDYDTISKIAKDVYEVLK